MPDSRQKVAVAVAIAEDLQKIAEQLHQQAEQDLAAGQLSLADYYAVGARCQDLQQQASIVALHADHCLVQEMAGEFARIQALTQGLRESMSRLKRIERVLDVVIKIAVAAGSVALAVVNPGLATVGAAIVALADATQTVGSTVR